MFFELHEVHDLTGKPFVIHDNSGARVACGLFAVMEAGVSSVELSPYGDGSTVTGAATVLYIAAIDAIYMWGHAMNLEANLVSSSMTGGSDCTATNGCGAHIHMGTACTDVSTQGGHLYNSSATTPDPWLTIGYHHTSATGYATFSGLAFGPYDPAGKPFVVHNNAGDRVACGMLAEAEEAEEEEEQEPEATMQVYHAHANWMDSTKGGMMGHMTVFVNGTSMYGVGFATGLEPNLPAADSTDCTATNGCGFHIHTGSACDDATTQGGHLYSADTDPWAEIRYETDPDGMAHMFFELHEVHDLTGKPFVIHDNSGARVACGLFAVMEAGVSSVELSPYGDGSTVTGAATVLYIAAIDAIYMWGHAMNLEANLVSSSMTGGSDCTATNGCGAHIHMGTACTDVSTQGGHLYNSSATTPDPWLTIGYHHTSATGYATFSGLAFGPYDPAGKPFVVHNNAGDRVACGMLSAPPTTPASSTDASGSSTDASVSAGWRPLGGHWASVLMCSSILSLLGASANKLP